MAWALPAHRNTCPGCGYSERILVIKDADGKYHLSCGWCARLSAPVEASEAFFGIWGGDRARRSHGASLRLSGVTCVWRGVITDYKAINVVLANGEAVVSVA